ncbi:MAG: protein kinase [Gammaproteobacteria bacterium]|nr:protein kinase [Gammaproteobacteria bacterium]
MSGSLFDNPAFLIKQNSVITIKNNQNDSTSVYLIAINNKKYVIKKYRSNSYWKFLINLFRTSKARLCFNNSLLLKSLSINVATPICYKEISFFGLKFGSYFVSEYIDGVTLCDYFAKNKKPISEWQDVANKIANLVSSLYKNNIVHHDFCGKNIMLKDGELFLLDLEHLKQYRKKNAKFLKLHQKDIGLFLNYFNLNKDAKRLCGKTLQS